MRLEELIEIIDEQIEFELFIGDRIGVFKTEDKGIKEYFNNEINEISVDKDRLIICLD